MGQQFRRLLLVIRCQLRRPEIKGQLVDGPGEMKRHLVTVVHRRTRIATNVEGLADSHEEGNRVRDRFAGVFLAIHRQYARATFARPRAVVFEVKDNRGFFLVQRVILIVSYCYFLLTIARQYKGINISLAESPQARTVETHP